jgi:membrane associated rhomboid family serine protease
MGIYDREYYRRESGLAGWFSGPAPATRTLILLNVVIYLIQLFTRTAPTPDDLAGYGWFTRAFSAPSSAIFEKFEIWRLITAAFLHSPDDLLHILWNMLFLFWFGREMEAVQGSREFTAFYLASAALSTLGWALLDRVMPYGGRGAMMGASGAATAVAVLFTLFYPNREVLLFFVLPMRMWVLLVIYLGLDSLNLVQQFRGQPTRPVAFGAHVTGAAFAFLYRSLNWRVSSLLDALRDLRRPRLRVVRPPAAPREAPRRGPAVRPEPGRAARPTLTPVVTEDQLDERLDEVLAKIAREGRDALSDDERKILEEASRRARLRRSDRP